MNKGPTLGEEDARCRATSTTISQDAPVVVSAMRGADGTMTVSDGVKASFQQVRTDISILAEITTGPRMDSHRDRL